MRLTPRVRIPWLALAVVLAPAAASAVVDDDAPTVYLRTDCGTLDDCFESAEALFDPSTGWVWNTRSPSEVLPLFVDAGPGDFGPFQCQGGNGWVTLRGSGPGVTSFTGLNQVIDCTELGFQDASFSAFGWIKAGRSTWTNIVLTGATSSGGATWYDACFPTIEENQSTHFFFSSTIHAGGNGAAFVSHCSETWFYGGDIVAADKAKAVQLGQLGDLRVFGGSVRVLSSGAVTDIITVELLGATSVFHMHGGILVANAKAAEGAGPAVDATAISSATGATAHTPGTAFTVVAANGGVATRLFGSAQSPFLHPPGTSPPAIVSLDGADLFVETDCNASGVCTGGTEAHLMIYNSASCGGTSPWLDAVTGACRP